MHQNGYVKVSCRSYIWAVVWMYISGRLFAVVAMVPFRKNQYLIEKIDTGSNIKKANDYAHDR